MFVTRDSEVADRMRALSNEELREIMSRCERAIAQGSAKVDDYQTFLLCQRELDRRTWG